MKIFRNKDNQIRSGWKIGTVFISFNILTILASSIFMIAYGAIITAKNPKLVSDQNNPMEYIEQQISGLNSFPGMCLHIIQCICLILAVMLFWRIWDKRKIRDIGFTNIKSSSKDLFTGLLIGAISFTIVAAVLLLTNSAELVNGFGSPKFSTGLIIQLVMFIFVGINEELFCRGYCMTVLKQTKKQGAPIVISSIIFSLMHSMNGGISFMAYINLFLFGISMGYLFLKIKNLWMCIGYHITWNYFQGDVFGFLVSGNVTESIYSIKTISPNIINGGNFGPEGGLIVTILLILTIFSIYKFVPNREA